MYIQESLTIKADALRSLDRVLAQTKTVTRFDHPELINLITRHQSRAREGVTKENFRLSVRIPEWTRNPQMYGETASYYEACRYGFYHLKKEYRNRDTRPTAEIQAVRYHYNSEQLRMLVQEDLQAVNADIRHYKRKLLLEIAELQARLAFIE